jgi:steroid delta-isomerase-like uncharacterized protein
VNAVAVEANKVLVRRFVEEVIGRGELEAVEELVAADYAYHAPGMEVGGREGVKQLFAMLRGAFPDWRESVEDLIAEGDKVVFRVTGRGTHQGAFMGIPPTGRPVTVAGTDVVHIRDGKIVEHWANFDQLGMMQQLGALPMPGSAAPATPGA